MADVRATKEPTALPRTIAEFIAEVRRVLPNAVFSDSDVSEITSIEWSLRLGALKIECNSAPVYGWVVWPGYTCDNLPDALHSARRLSETRRDAASVIIAALDKLEAQVGPRV